MATRQSLLPGYGYINETETPPNKEALLPGYGYVNETAAAADAAVTYARQRGMTGGFREMAGGFVG